MATIMTVLLLGLALPYGFARLHFSLKDCTNSQNRILRVSNVHLSADPVHIPGPETFSGDLEVLRPISGHIRLDVHIERHLLFGWPDIPCLTVGGQRIGTCSYNLCDLLVHFKDANGTTHCPVQLAQDNFLCTCPFQPGHYHLSHATFQIPEVSSILKILANGDYRVDVKFVDTNTGATVACYHAEGSVSS